MKRKILVVMLAMSLVGALSNVGAAQVLGYNLDKAERGFRDTKQPEPSSAKMATDALIARPLGLGVPILGTGLFLLTLPTSIATRTTPQTAHTLVGKPGGWTFASPLGINDPRFEEKGIFGE